MKRPFAFFYRPAPSTRPQKLSGTYLPTDPSLCLLCIKLDRMCEEHRREHELSKVNVERRGE